MRSAGSFFFPLDVRLGLGTEGYSPAVLAKAVRQASKASSFAEASDDLRELAEVEISPTHLQRLSERIGEEWVEIRDEEVEKFRQRRAGANLQGAAARGGGGDAGRRPFADACRGLRPGRERAELARVEGGVLPDARRRRPRAWTRSRNRRRSFWSRRKRRVWRRKSSGAAGRRRSGTTSIASEAKSSKGRRSGRSSQKRRRWRKRNRTRVRTVVATMENSETFGWQVAAEVHRRGLDQAKRKACVCDGQAYNWSIYEMHLLPAGVHRDLGFRSPPGVPLRRGPRLSRLGRGAGLEDVRAVAPLGVVGKSRHAAVEPACRGRGVGGERFGRGGQKANGRGDVDVRDEQPRTHGLSRVPPLGPADQQRPGGVDDQANQPPRQRQREILAGRRCRSDPATACGPIEPRRPLEPDTGRAPANTAAPPAPAASPRPRERAGTGMHPAPTDSPGKYVTIAEAARLLSLSPQSLRAWDRAGRLDGAVVRTPGGHRRFNLDQLQAEALGVQPTANGSKVPGIYVRVSNKSQNKVNNEGKRPCLGRLPG